MIKLTDQFNKCALQNNHVTHSCALTLLLMLSALLVACGAKLSGQPMHAQEVSVATLLSSSGQYEGAPIRTDVCVNVTIHDITLLPCGAKNPQIDFEMEESQGSRKAYSRFIEFAHANLGKKPEDLTVTVEGVYRRSQAVGGSRHVIYITDFTPLRIDSR